MTVNIPQNSYMALMVYFSSNEKPMSRKEMDEFWDSCSPAEKHYYMCADLTQGRTEGNVNLHSMARIMPQNEFAEWYYGRDHQPWCEAILPPHYHTADGLKPATPYEKLLRDRGLNDFQYEKDRVQKFLGMRPQFQIVDEIQNMPEYEEKKPLRHDGWYYGKDVGEDEGPWFTKPETD